MLSTIINFSKKAIAFVFIAASSPAIAQTYYSTFTSPVNGTHYSSSINGVCIGCSANGVSNSASNSMSDSSRVVITAGVLNGYTTRLKLTDTANSTASIILKDNASMLTISVFSNITISTYLGGTLRETFSGSSLSMSNISGSKNEIQAAASMNYDAIEFSISGFLSVGWNFNVYYGKGLNIAPLPVVFSNLKAEIDCAGNGIINWTTSEAEDVLKYEVYGNTDEKGALLLGSIMPFASREQMNAYELAFHHQGLGINGFFIKAVHLNGKDEYSEVFKAEDWQMNLNSEIKFYPNPAVSELNVEMNNASSIEISNSNLTVVYSKDIYENEANETIDLNQLNPGRYLLSVKLKNSEIIRKVFIRL